MRDACVAYLLLYAELSLLLVHLFESALTLLVGHRLLCLACCAHGLAYGCRGLVGVACRQSGGYASLLSVRQQPEHTRRRSMSALYGYLARLVGGLYQYGSRAPFNDARVCHDVFAVAYYAAFASTVK